MISNTKLKRRSVRKTSPVLVETLSEARKSKEWNEVAKLLSGPSRNLQSKNLFEIEKETKEGDTVVVVGKVLSKGELTKKIRLCAFAISKKAAEKAKESKTEVVSILEEIKKNPKAEGTKLLR